MHICYYLVNIHNADKQPKKRYKENSISQNLKIVALDKPNTDKRNAP